MSEVHLKSFVEEKSYELLKDVVKYAVDATVSAVDVLKSAGEEIPSEDIFTLWVLERIDELLRGICIGAVKGVDSYYHEILSMIKEAYKERVRK